MDSSRRKHGPAWFRIIMLSATAFAIDFALSVEAAYSLPAILKTGLDEKYAPVLWAIGPLLGILFQGCLGSASDRCKCSWGRRRPFILGLAIVVCICAGLFPLVSRGHTPFRKRGKGSGNFCYSSLLPPHCTVECVPITAQYSVT